MTKDVASFGYVEKQDKFAFMFCSDVQPHLNGNVTLTRISSRLPVAKSQPRLSRDSVVAALRKHLMSCNVRRLRITTERALKFVPGMASKMLRHSHPLHCALLSNMWQNWHAGRAILDVFVYTVSDFKRRNFSRAMKLFVEEPH